MPPSKITKLKFYGYVINSDWLYEWGVKNGCAPTEPLPPPSEFDPESYTRANAHEVLLEKAGLKRKDAGFRSFRILGEQTTCLVLTTNEPNPRFRRLAKEKYAMLKEVLETEEDPKWWVVGSRG